MSINPNKYANGLNINAITKMMTPTIIGNFLTFTNKWNNDNACINITHSNTNCKLVTMPYATTLSCVTNKLTSTVITKTNATLLLICHINNGLNTGVATLNFLKIGNVTTKFTSTNKNTHNTIYPGMLAYNISNETCKDSSISVVILPPIWKYDSNTS